MIKVNNIGVCINRRTITEKWIVDDINLDIKKGEFVAVVGPNGAGKSSLLKLIAQEIKPSKGTAQFSYSAKDIGIIFQDPSHGTWEDLTVDENMQLALFRRRALELDIVVHLQTLKLGLENKMDLPVRLLSGGQRQSLNLLMATINQPKILLLDEHTSALDPKTAMSIMEMTAQLCAAQQITTIMVTHNLKFAVQYATRILIINEGKLSHDIQHKITVQKLFSLC